MPYVSTNCQPSVKLPSNKVFASPTFSYQSHDKWASKIVNALDEIHMIAPPTHWATIKCNQYLHSNDIRWFLSRLSKAIEYQNTKKQGCFAVFAIPEVDDIGVVHFHVLIRATIDPLPFLASVINKHNSKTGRRFSIDYLEKPTSVEAVTKYSAKLGRHDINLFSSGSLTRYTYTAGKYFLGKKRKELVKQSLEKFFEITEVQEANVFHEWDSNSDSSATPCNETDCEPLMGVDGEFKEPDLIKSQNKQCKNYSGAGACLNTMPPIRKRHTPFVSISSIRNFKIMMRFSEYCQIREGLWLNDKNALPGYSRAKPLPKKPLPKSFPVFTPPKPPAIKAIVPPALVAAPRVYRQ